MRNLILKNLIIVMLLSFSTSLIGQLQFQSQGVAANSNFANKPYYMYIFPSDSIQGFDQNATNQQALNRKCFGVEYHMYNYWEKRRFIKQKYNLDPTSNNNNSAANARPIINPTANINSAPCVNEDFEASPATLLTTAASAINNTLTGWQVTNGNTQVNPYDNCLNNNICTSSGCTYAWVRQTPWTPPAQTNLGTITASPFGGNNVLQMSDDLAGGKAVAIQQTFPVTASNCLFQLAFRASLLSGHACCQNPYIKITVIDCFNNVLTCPAVNVQPPGPSCASVVATGWQTNSNTWVSYTPNWIIKSLDLTPYLNSCVTIKIEVGDCPYGGHFGTAYIDSQCLPMNVNVNSINFPAGNPIVAIAACGVLTASITAPPGLGPYQWIGPISSTVTNQTNQTIYTTVPGNYTLIMNPPGSCAPITKTLSLQFGSFPTANFSVANNCTTYTITNTGSPAPAIQSYSFTGPGAPVSFTTTNSTSVVNFAPNTTYTIWQTVTNAQNCPSTHSMVITTPNGPSPAFTASPSFTLCIGQNPTFSAVTSAGSHTYSFASNTISPATIFTDPAGPVTFASPGTYTVTHTINNAGCIASTSSVVVINSLPTATVNAISPLCIGSSATLNAIGGPGQLTWTGPAAYSAPGPTAQVGNFQPANAGIYTLTINNFGCITTKTVLVTSPVGPTITVSNNGPVCVGSPLVLTATWPASIVPVWYYWYTYIPAPYYYSYGNYNVAQYTVTPSAALTDAVPMVFWIQLNNNCPTVTYTTNVSVITLTTPVVSNTGPYCPGANIQLNSNIYTATTFTWTGPNSYSQTSVQNPQITNASAAVAGPYTITTGAGSCKKSAVTTVSVYPNPNALAGSNSPVCLGQSINLTSNAASTYTWSGPNAFSSNLQNPSIANSSLLMAGTYTLKITTAQGCTAVTTVTVGVLTPTTSASNTGPYCSGANIQLNSPAATSYSWTGPNAFTSNAQNPIIANSSTIASGNYTIVAAIGTCSAMATTSVTVYSLPTPTAINTGPYCVNQNIQLSVNAFNTYTWSGPNTYVSNAQNPSITTASVINGGNYTVVVVDAHGCVNSTTTNVVVNPLPVITVNNPTACINGNITLTSSAASSYTWAGPLAFASALQNPSITNVTPAMSGNYTITQTSGFGCVNSAIAVVSVVPLPTVSIVGTNTLCSQNFNGSPNTVIITASGASSYIWTMPVGFIGSPSLTQSSLTLNPPVTAVQTVAQLSVTGTAAYGCSTSAVYNVTVVPNPTIVPAPATSSVCQGVSINLSVGGASTYTWSPSATLNTNTGPSVIASSSITTVYSIIGSDQGCNSATQNSTLNVVANPTVVITPGQPTICIGQSIALIASGASTYSWTPNTALSATTGAIVNANPTVNMTYSVLGSQATCTNIAAVTVTVLSLPIINVTPSSPTLCMNGFNGSPNTVVFAATGAVTYTWGGFMGMTANQTTGTSIIATSILQSAALSGTVLGFDGSCYNTGTYNALAVPNPTISVTSNSMCSGTTAQLIASGANAYNWSPGNNLNSTTAATVIANPSGNTIYNVFGSVAGCNSSSESSTVTVVANPVIVVSPVTPTICEGGSIGLTAFGATDYTWSPSSSLNASNGNFVIASPIVTTDYLVIGSAASCTSSTIRQVQVTPLPHLSVVAERTVLCKGEKTTLNANGSTTYTWMPFGAVPDQFSNFNTISPTLTTVYSLIGNNGPCTATLQVPITVLNLPILELSTNLQKICLGNNTSILASGADSYTWTPNINMNIISANVAVVNPSVSTNYTVMGVNYSGTVACEMTKEILIDVVQTVSPSISRSVAICQGESTKLTAGGSDSYVWTPAMGLNNTLTAQPYANPRETTVYTVQVSNGGFCGATATVLVQVNETPTVNAGPDMIYNVDDPMYLDAKGTGTLTWIFGDGILCKDCPNSQIMPQNSGCYQIQAVTNQGCKAVDEVCIEVTKDYNIYIPNTFTPNYDGLNDLFLVYGTGITKLEMSIFDRWGAKLYTSNDQLKGWDGTVKGEESKQDVYTYVVTFTSIDSKQHTKTGHVTLLR